jgi:polar amino acid transport system permease protein
VWTQALERETNFSVYLEYAKVIFKGWVTTLGISAVSLLLALLVGLILYAMRISGSLLLRYLAEIHKTVVFSTPLLVIAIVAYFYIGNAFRLDSKFWVGTVTLALYTGAYISDIYQAAVESIHMNQWQTAEMFGFTKLQTYRYIIFPQVLTGILPPLAGQLAMTIKSSALLSYMGTDEYFNVTRTVMSISFRYPEGFIIMAIGYWIITMPLISLVRRLEEKLNYRLQA